MSDAPLKIGIIGAGFSGTSVAALLNQLSPMPLEIILFDKSGDFGAGPAYSTPFPHHLLNVRANNMSAFEQDPNHFCNWLTQHAEYHKLLESTVEIGEQFVPRILYRKYLHDLLQEISHSKKIKLSFVNAEVIDVTTTANKAILSLDTHQQVEVDKVILALGNTVPAGFPFPLHSHQYHITNPWDYRAVMDIPKDASVLILGTGLSMIDAVLSLQNQQHTGPIIAVSRHGLLPLPHAETTLLKDFEKKQLPNDLRKLTKFLRVQSKEFTAAGGNWQAIFAAIRVHFGMLWRQATLTDKKRFVRHVLPYWNVHRHRVHEKISQFLDRLRNGGQLAIISGRVLSVNEDKARVKLRHQNIIQEVPADWLINCIGPTLDMRKIDNPLIQHLLKKGIASFDELNLGFAIDKHGELKNAAGETSSVFYTLGPPTKGETWECTAVPEIRKQSLELVKHLVDSLLS